MVVKLRYVVFISGNHVNYMTSSREITNGMMVRLGYFRNVGAVSVDSDHTTKTTHGKCREVPKTQYDGVECEIPKN